MTLLGDSQTSQTSPTGPNSLGEMLGDLHVGRRTTIVAGLSGASIPALGLLGRAPAFVSGRPDLTTGVRSGEVTTNSGVIWSRGLVPSRMLVRRHSNGRDRRMIRGPWTNDRTDFTARLHLSDLRPGGAEAAHARGE